MNLLDMPSYDWGNVDSPWISVDLSIWDCLIQKRPVVKYAAGSDIFWQNKKFANVYVIAKGRVCVNTLSADGQLKQIYIACPGAMIGEISCILGKDHMTAATAITATECYSIPSKEVQKLFHSDPRFADLLLQYVARKARMLIYQNAMLSFDPAEQRVAKILLCLSETYGAPATDGTELALRFTHTDVASIANTSRVTVNNTLTSFINSGILLRRGSHYVILDMEKLQEIAFYKMN